MLCTKDTRDSNTVNSSGKVSKCPKYSLVAFTQMIKKQMVIDNGNRMGDNSGHNISRMNGGNRNSSGDGQMANGRPIRNALNVIEQNQKGHQEDHLVMYLETQIQ